MGKEALPGVCLYMYKCVPGGVDRVDDVTALHDANVKLPSECTRTEYPRLHIYTPPFS